MTQIAEGKWFDVDEGSKRTFLELVDRYESTEFKEFKSWRSVESYLKQLKEFFGPYTLSQINPALIDEFKQQRKSKRGQACNDCAKRGSNAVLRGVLYRPPPLSFATPNSIARMQSRASASLNLIEEVRNPSTAYCRLGSWQ
jgi:hypothetical protein